MKIVLDVSATIPVLLDHELEEKFSEIISNAELIIAPEIFIPELGNALWKYVNFSDLDVEMGSRLLVLGLSNVDRFFSQYNLSELAFELSIKHNTSIYDSMYLSLCVQTGYKLLSNDKILNGAAEKLDVKFEHI